MAPGQYVDWAIRTSNGWGVSFDGTPERIEAMMREGRSVEGDIYLDYDVKGNLLSRPALDALFRASLGDPQITHVLIPRRDRLARPDDPIDGVKMETRLRTAGKTLVFMKLTLPPLRRGQKADIAETITAVFDYDRSDEERIDLAQKSIDAQIRLAKLDYSTGGRPPYGFRRWLVKEDGTRVRELAGGERVRMAGHHVVWLPTAEDELRVSRLILQLLETMPASRVAAHLTTEATRFMLSCIQQRLASATLLPKMERRFREFAVKAKANQEAETATAKLRTELAELQEELKTVSSNMSRAKTEAQYTSISADFEELRDYESRLAARIADEESNLSHGGDAEAEVTAALGIVQRLTEVMADSGRLDLARQAFQMTNARLFLRFHPVQVKKRLLNKVAEGVVTFGAAPDPIEIYRGPTGRRALKQSCAASTELGNSSDTPPVPRWSVEKAKQWYQAQPWPVGCNYIPSTAVNQIETWQAESFDPQTIDREMGWAEDLGFNTVRIFLHDLVWEADPAGFKDRLGKFLTAPLWALPSAPSTSLDIVSFLYENCDVMSFHSYRGPKDVERFIKLLQVFDRPIFCTEYMARPHSTFRDILPILKREHVGAMNFGLVAGKGNFYFPWGSKPGSPEPKIWHHDILRSDGTPYDPQETAFIRQLTGRDR